MARNIILFTSTLAILILMFVVYIAVFSAPAPTTLTADDEPVELHQAKAVAEEQKMHVETPDGPVSIDPGEEMAYVQYDELGRPTDYFRCESWEKAPDSESEFTVATPEIMLRMNTGIIVMISSERGRLSADRLDTKHFRPKRGSLTGDALIVVDRETSFDRTPLTERPEDRIEIAMDSLVFDLELGELKTAGPIRVASPEFEIAAAGMHLIWNQDNNRVEKLLIERGGSMVFRGDMLDSISPSSQTPPSEDFSLSTRPVARAASPRGERRRPVAYMCEFLDDVFVEHFVGEECRDTLSADSLSLLMDIAGGGVLRRDDASAASSPVSTPAPTTQERRIVINWSGALLFRPDANAAASDQRRRRIEVFGAPVVIETADGRVSCGRLTLHQENKQLWLYPTDAGVVEISSGEAVAMQAASIYVDLESNLIKLVGDVLFSAGQNRAGHKEELTINAEDWAELYIGERGPTGMEEDVFGNPLASQMLESAAFVGDVVVRYQDQKLSAHKLTAAFNPTAGSPADAAAGDPQSLLKSVTAEGDVQLLAVDSGRRTLWRPPTINQSLNCARLRLGFLSRDGETHINGMYADGAVEIYDRRNKFAARGRELKAGFGEQQTLTHATITGAAHDHALMDAREFKLRGREIVVDNQAQTLHIDGDSELSFMSSRGLQGLPSLGEQAINVTCTRSMHIDWPANKIDFVGDVAAGSDNEKLLADSMTLMLGEAPVVATEQSGMQIFALGREWVRGLLGGADVKPAAGDLFGDSREAGGRKQLSRIIARNAAVQAETYAEGVEQAVVHQSIEAPLLEIDANTRCIRTIGYTTMLMTDLRHRDAGADRPAAVNLVSALAADGPSQTAMESRGGMLYVLGDQPKRRRDSLLLEGGVRFRYVTGREMKRLTELLPDVVMKPELLKTITSQNTYLECDRLECTLLMADAAVKRSLGMQSSMTVALLNARENVLLRDKRGDDVREIYAHQLEYDAEAEVIRILGHPDTGVLARIYDQNEKTGRFNKPAEAPEIIINLATNTIEAKDLRGKIGN